MHRPLTFPHQKGYTEQYIAVVFGKQHWPKYPGKIMHEKESSNSFQTIPAVCQDVVGRFDPSKLYK